MSVVTRAVNFIRSNALNHRDFKTFLEMLGEDFNDIPHYTEVRWLSRATVLSRFFHLRERFAAFLDLKGHPEPLLSDPIWVSDLGFLVDVTELLNVLNLKLQRSNLVITDMISKVEASSKKIELLITHIEEGNLVHLPQLGKKKIQLLFVVFLCRILNKIFLTASVKREEQFKLYVEKLENLKEEFADRFQASKNI